MKEFAKTEDFSEINGTREKKEALFSLFNRCETRIDNKMASLKISDEPQQKSNREDIDYVNKRWSDRVNIRAMEMGVYCPPVVENIIYNIE